MFALLIIPARSLTRLCCDVQPADIKLLLYWIVELRDTIARVTFYPWQIITFCLFYEYGVCKRHENINKKLDNGKKKKKHLVILLYQYYLSIDRHFMLYEYVCKEKKSVWQLINDNLLCLHKIIIWNIGKKSVFFQ